MIMKNEHLIEYFPNYLSTDSLFTKMSMLGAPWSQEIGQDMDDAYFTMYSGVKNPSQFVKLHMLNGSVNSLTIARIVLSIYKEPWERLWAALETKYDAIADIDITESITRWENNERSISRNSEVNATLDSDSNSNSTRNDKTDRDSTTTESGKVTNTGSTELEHGETIASNAESDTYTYGFNSAEKVPTAVSIDADTVTHSGVDTTSVSNNQVSDNDTIVNDSTTLTSSVGMINHAKDISKTDSNDSTSEQTTGSENITSNRSGISGRRTYQELLQSEFELWRWNFFTQIFEDVDKYLVLNVYNC